MPFIFACALLAGAFVSPSAQYQIQRGLDTVYRLTVQNQVRFEAVTLDAAPANGALQYDGSALYFSLDGVRRAITVGNDTRIASETVTNTTTETTIHTSAIAANSLKAGKMYKVTLLGKTTTANASQFFTLRFKMGGVTLLTARRWRRRP